MREEKELAMATEKECMLSDNELGKVSGGYSGADYQDYHAFDAVKYGYHCPKCGEQNMGYMPQKMGEESNLDRFCCMNCFADFYRSEAVVDGTGTK